MAFYCFKRWNWKNKKNHKNILGSNENSFGISLSIVTMKKKKNSICQLIIHALRALPDSFSRPAYFFDHGGSHPTLLASLQWEKKEKERLKKCEFPWFWDCSKDGEEGLNCELVGDKRVI